MCEHDEALEAEAQAFDQRITERRRAGFIPDLRRIQKNEYFYKSFWRDPLFVELYLGRMVADLLELIATHCGPQQRILDVGCGAGYISLELARNGHQVMGIDISEACIQVARETAEQNPYLDGFGSLEYRVEPWHAAAGTYDVILFCGSLHHMEDVELAVQQAHAMLPAGGHLVCHEPCHERFRKEDAAQVALIRGLLSLTGCWYDAPNVTPLLTSESNIGAYIDEVHTEYVRERDKDEPGGQSPSDLSASGEQILAALRSCLAEIEFRPGASFIYRLLGGIRGPDEVIRGLARFIAHYERMLVRQGWLRPNAFYFVGQKK